MSDIIEEKNIQILESVNGWREGIRIASKPLLDNEYINENYIDSMIENIERFGFYIVITDKVALPHSRPENGTKKTGISMLKLETPVMFGDEEVYLIVVLSVKEEKEHIDLLMKISKIFEDDDIVNNLIKLETKDEIIKFISKYSGGGVE